MKFLAGTFCGVASVLLVMSLYRRPEPEPAFDVHDSQCIKPTKHRLPHINDRGGFWGWGLITPEDDWATDPYTRGLVQ